MQKKRTVAIGVLMVLAVALFSTGCQSSTATADQPLKPHLVRSGPGGGDAKPIGTTKKAE